MTWRSHRLLLGLPILGFLALLVVFATTNLDLSIEQRFYDHSSGTWPWEWKQPWIFLNLYGEFPGLLLGLGSLFVLLLGIGRPRLHPHRKVATFLLGGLLLGPGLIVNAILKDHWDRPRPDSIIPFGGKYAFEPFLHFDPSSPGSSFPSGHASMGFFTMAVGLLLLAAGRPRAGRIVLLGSLLVGFFIGFSRVACGKHFTSDVLSAGFLIWITTILLFFGMKMHRSLQFAPRPARPVGWGSRIMRGLSPLLVLLIVALAAVKWPLFEGKDISISTPGLPAGAAMEIVLDVEGSVFIQSGEQLHLRTITDGHGLATARLLTTTALSGNTLTVTHARQGLFSKLHPNTYLFLPPGRKYTVTLGERTTGSNSRKFRSNADGKTALTILRTGEQK